MATINCRGPQIANHHSLSCRLLNIINVASEEDLTVTASAEQTTIPVEGQRAIAAEKITAITVKVVTKEEVFDFRCSMKLVQGIITVEADPSHFSVTTGDDGTVTIKSIGFLAPNTYTITVSVAGDIIMVPACLPVDPFDLTKPGIICGIRYSYWGVKILPIDNMAVTSLEAVLTAPRTLNLFFDNGGKGTAATTTLDLKQFATGAWSLLSPSEGVKINGSMLFIERPIAPQTTLPVVVRPPPSMNISPKTINYSTTVIKGGKATTVGYQSTVFRFR